MTANKPIRVFSFGSMRVSVWIAGQERSTRGPSSYSFRLEKRFFDEKQKRWRDSDYLFADDIPRACAVLQRAFEFTSLREEEPGKTP